MHAVETLQLAERAMEATPAFKSRGSYLDPEALDRRSMRGKKTSKTPTLQTGGRESDPLEENYTLPEAKHDGGAVCAGFHRQWEDFDKFIYTGQNEDSFCDPLPERWFGGNATHGQGADSLNNKKAVWEICEISNRKLAW